MNKTAWGDVLKVWLYAAATLWLGAWFSPLLYNAGKALAEVSQGKRINGPLEWLAGLCARAEFAGFFTAAVACAALVLFLPWMEWLGVRRGAAVASGPWGLHLPNGARMPEYGQQLEKNPRGPWQMCAGFLLVAGLLLPLGLALVAAGWFMLRLPQGAGLALHVAQAVLLAMAAATLAEFCIRGIVMGIFLRAMRPAAALGMTAAFHALLFSLWPARRVSVADPESAGAGFEMLRLLAQRFAEGEAMLHDFVPLLALGLVLAYARWRTASLWLPVGMHAGWLTSKIILNGMTATVMMRDSLVGIEVMRHFVLPHAALAGTAVLAHVLTADSAKPHVSGP